MVIDPVQARAVAHQIRQMLGGFGRGPREVGNPDLVIAALGPDTLDDAVAVAIGRQCRDHALREVEAFDRGRRNHSVQARRSVADDLYSASIGSRHNPIILLDCGGPSDASSAFRRYPLRRVLNDGLYDRADWFEIDDCAGEAAMGFQSVARD